MRNSARAVVPARLPLKARWSWLVALSGTLVISSVLSVGIRLMHPRRLWRRTALRGVLAVIVRALVESVRVVGGP